MDQRISLEHATEKVCIESAKPPLLYQLPPAQAREVLNTAQNAPVFKYPAKVKTTRIDTGKWGAVTTHFITPPKAIICTGRV